MAEALVTTLKSLKLHGLAIQSASEANRIRMSRMTAEARRDNALQANEARRKTSLGPLRGGPIQNRAAYARARTRSRTRSTAYPASHFHAPLLPPSPSGHYTL